jgi:hypothetical protein
MSRSAPVMTASAFLTLSSFRDMNGIIELPAVHTGASTAVVSNSHLLHLESEIFGEERSAIACRHVASSVKVRPTTI